MRQTHVRQSSRGGRAIPRGREVPGADEARVAHQQADPLPTAAAVEDLLTEGAVEAVFQPIVSVADGRIIGYESLARMRHRTITAGPDRWLAAAHEAGLGTDLELLCLRAAASAGMPPGDARLFVNVTAPVLADPRAVALFDGVHSRVVLEISETLVIGDYEEARRAMRCWAELGSRLAIDDTGSGYASLRHVLQLAPDYIKLDRSLISGIADDRNKRALANALTTFARELGAAVVAEGVEQPDELEVLRESGVDLVQGWLLARPGPPWSTAANPSRVLREGLGSTGLATALESAVDPLSACDLAVDHLAQRSDFLPSAYLVAGDRLRCMAQRGLWQILDGLDHGSGVTGQCVAEGQEIVVPDVGDSAVYREAIPGVRSEACVPIRVEGMVVGALNIDSRRQLTDHDIDELRTAAALLGERLAVVGREPLTRPIDRLGRHQRRLSSAADDGAIVAALLDGVIDISGMSSAALTVESDGRDSPSAAVGPLRRMLTEAIDEHAEELLSLVQGTTSCYTAGSVLGQSFIGMDALRSGGVRALVVLPLTARGARLGMLLVAHSDPCAFRTEEVEPLELLADYAAMLLSGRIERTIERRSVRHDHRQRFGRVIR